MSDWTHNQKQNPPPEGVMVEAHGCDYMGDYTRVAQRIDYKPGSSKSQLRRKWRWCNDEGQALADQAFDAWRKLEGGHENDPQ